MIASVHVIYEEAKSVSKGVRAELESASTSFEGSIWNMRQADVDSLCVTVDSCQTLDAKKISPLVSDLHFDLAFVYGTGKLMPDLIELLPQNLLNLHGGDTELYRGLDSLLWAIYHRDWECLTVTLHYVSAELDAGDIVFKSSIDLNGIQGLEQLRYHTTLVAVGLAEGAIEFYKSLGWVPRTPQRSIGRYYSSLPGSLISACQARFVEKIKARALDA